MDACVSSLTDISSTEIEFSLVGESSVELSKDLTAWNNKKDQNQLVPLCLLHRFLQTHFVLSSLYRVA